MLLKLNKLSLIGEWKKVLIKERKKVLIGERKKVLQEEVKEGNGAKMERKLIIIKTKGENVLNEEVTQEKILRDLSAKKKGGKAGEKKDKKMGIQEERESQFKIIGNNMRGLKVNLGRDLEAIVGIEGHQHV